jgi:anthranilate/para-aminobenzoate synthase component I
MNHEKIEISAYCPLYNCWHLLAMKQIVFFPGFLSSYAAMMSSQQHQQQQQQQQQQQPLPTKLFPPLRLFTSQQASLESIYRSPIQSSFLSNISKVKNLIFRGRILQHFISKI